MYSVPGVLLLFCFLIIATDDLDFVSMDGALIVELEVDILNDEGPDVVAEAVGVEMALFNKLALDCASFLDTRWTPRANTYLEA